MRCLLIGASGFIGPHVVRALSESGHDAATFGRGETATIRGDRQHILDCRTQIMEYAPDVVIDLILSSGKQTSELMETLRGMVGRVVGISSGDVYRACGILHGTESGPLQSVPLTEESELRTNRQVYSPEVTQHLKNVFEWLDDEYDKIAVEEVVMSDAALPGTVLRLPMIYGPGDRLHRFLPYLKRMDDQRPAVLIQEDAAQWRAPRGYVENVAAAIALAAIDERAAGRIYNVAEPHAYSEKEWARKIADQVGWPGKIVALPKEQIPAHLKVPSRCEQDWVTSSERIRRELGYVEPVAEDVALARTIAWERANPDSIFRQVFDYEAEDQALAALAL